MVEWFSSPHPSSGVVSSRLWVRIPDMTLVPLRKAFKNNCLVKRFEGSALDNPVPALGVGGSVPLVTVKCSPHIQVVLLASIVIKLVQ